MNPKLSTTLQILLAVVIVLAVSYLLGSWLVENVAGAWE
jgi:hypothetical protein